MSQDERAADDRDRDLGRGSEDGVGQDARGGADRDAGLDANHGTETLSSFGPGTNHNLLGATLRSPDSVEDLGEDRRHDRLAAAVSIGIFVVLGIALGLFLALR